MPLGVNVGLGWCLLPAAVNLIWSLCVLSCKITNVRDAGHFVREGLQGVQELHTKPRKRGASDNDIQCLTESLTGRTGVSPRFDI